MASFGVLVGVTVLVSVGVTEGVAVSVDVLVDVLVRVGVSVGVEVGVAVGVGGTQSPPTQNAPGTRTHPVFAVSQSAGGVRCAHDGALRSPHWQQST